MLKRPLRSIEISPTVKQRWPGRLRAISFGRKRSRSATLRTAVRVSSRSCPLPLSAFETVLTLTPAALATSRMVSVDLTPCLRAKCFRSITRYQEEGTAFSKLLLSIPHVEAARRGATMGDIVGKLFFHGNDAGGHGRDGSLEPD